MVGHELGEKDVLAEEFPVAVDDDSYREGLASLEDGRHRYKAGTGQMFDPTLSTVLQRCAAGDHERQEGTSKDFSFLLTDRPAERHEEVAPSVAATPFGARRLELPRRSSEKPGKGRRNGESKPPAERAPQAGVELLVQSHWLVGGSSW
eukprot:Skav229337  [mRNA]  locus=scaffold2596:95463:101382:- [translate_table: standard]